MDIWVSMYKEGDSCEVRGIKCDVKRMKFQEMEHYASEGWVKDPADIGQEQEVSEEEATEGAHEVRLMAKAKGIEGWDKKRIKTLKAELDENQG